MKKAAVAWVLLAVACGSTDEQTVRQFDPYGGDAYPNKRPRIAYPAGDVALVSNVGNDTVSVIDVAGRSVVGVASVGRNPVALDGPSGVAADRARGVAYVALSYPAIAATGPHAAQHGARTPLGYVQKLSLEDFRPLGEVKVEQSPGDLVLSDDGMRVVVSHFDLELARGESPRVDDKRADLMWTKGDDIVEGTSKAPTTIARVCVAPNGIALSPGNGATAYVACYGEDALTIVNLDDPLAAVERIPIGTSPSFPGRPVFGPYSVVRSPSAGRLAVSNVESKDVRLFDVATKTFGPAIPTTGAPYAAAWAGDESRLFVPTESPDALVVIDVAAGTVVQTAPLSGCGKPRDAVFSSDRATLWVPCEGASALVALDAKTLEIVTSLPVGTQPERIVMMRP